MDNWVLPEDVISMICTEYINFSELETWFQICKSLYEKIKSRLTISYVSGNTVVSREEYYSRIQTTIKYCMNPHKCKKYNINKMVPFARIVMFKRDKFVVILGDKTHCNVEFYTRPLGGMGVWNPTLTLCFQNFTVSLGGNNIYACNLVWNPLKINYGNVEYFVSDVEIRTDTHRVHYVNDYVTMHDTRARDIMETTVLQILDCFYKLDTAINMPGLISSIKN